jgi:hypothetical protein
MRITLTESLDGIYFTLEKASGACSGPSKLLARPGGVAVS